MYKKLLLIIMIFLMIGCGNEKQTIKYELIIDRKEISMNSGEKSKISAYILNNDSIKIEYDSSNSDIVSVTNDGELFAKSSGDAKIFVSYKENNKLQYDIVNVHVNGDSATNPYVRTISFLNTNILMQKGSTYEMKYRKDPENSDLSDVIFYSSDNKIASISSSGVITAHDVGTCIVSAKARENASNVVVTVINEEVFSHTDIIPTNIILENSNITMEIGEKNEIEYSLSPPDATNRYIEITSDNPSVISISDNIINALKEGNATVTIKSINNVYKNINVKVNPKKEKTSDSLMVLQSSKNINMKACTISKINISSKSPITYISNNPTIASVDSNGVVTAHKNNASTVITASDGTNKLYVNVIINGSNCKTNNSRVDNTPVDSSGKIDPSLRGSGSDEGFRSCRNASPYLTLKINGKTYGQDGRITMKVGETLTVNVLLPTKCGKIIRITRTTADGQKNWRNYASGHSEPFVDRYNSKTFVYGVTEYKWIIKANARGEVILSQTAQFDVKTASGLTGNIQSMVRLHVKIIS